MTKTIQLLDAANFHADLPHQIAAWNWLQDQLTAEQLAEFAEIYRAEPEQKEALPPPWLDQALKAIKRFEGCKLKSYLCPAGVWSIGWGSTNYLGSPVKEGDQINQQWADDLLRNSVLNNFGAGLFKLLPDAKQWPSHQIAALVSFAYNVGLGAFEESTLHKRLKVSTGNREQIVREEMPKWIHGGGVVLAGLERRRATEIDLFCNDPTKLKAKPPRTTNPLRVTYYSQRDSTIPGQASRMCFSSSCAMMLSKLRPELLGGKFGDDVYLRRLSAFGDTTEARAHIQTLESYKVKAELMLDADWQTVEEQIDRGIPVPLGFYHHGTVDNPSRDGGHWLCAIGYDDAGIFVNDPWGDLDLVAGHYVSQDGKGLHYSRKNFGPRWLADGPSSGWAIIATP